MKNPPVEEGTRPDIPPTPSGRSKSTTETQQKHNTSITDSDLIRVVEVWDSLPEAIKRGILAMIREVE
ncbi:MAG: hypothetical protein ACYS8W_14460 [Planctomycetota bacterium]